MTDRQIGARYVRWSFSRAFFHRGWWLVTSLYLVVEARLSPFELVFVGTAQSLVGLLFEIPTGVVADTVSRKLSLLIAHALMGAAMLATGLVTAFPALVATQMLWGLSWTFSSGADVAWLTDELERPERAAAVLVAAARADQVGSACGLLALGGLAWATDLSTAIVVAGAAMWAIGASVAIGFPERGFAPLPGPRVRGSLRILRAGARLARRDRPILAVLVATVLVNGASDAAGRLYPKHLLDLGLPASPDPIVWLTGLGLASLLVAALALRIAEPRLGAERAAPRAYALGALGGAIGLALLAFAPDPLTGMAGVLVASGLAWPLTRCVSVIWVNQRATSEVRATVQSMLGQAEYAGEIGLGLALGVVAQWAGIPNAVLAGAGLAVLAALVVSRR